MAANVFLILNGVELDVSQDVLAEMVLAVARGELTKSEVAVFLRDHSREA